MDSRIMDSKIILPGGMIGVLPRGMAVIGERRANASAGFPHKTYPEE
jgi:hypothetical protein